MSHLRVLFVGTTVALLSACGASTEAKPAVPSRDQLAAQIAEAGGVDKATASCAADALYDNLSEEDLAKVIADEEPSADAKTRFTDAVLDCLSGTTLIETLASDVSATTDPPAAPTTTAPTTTAPTTTAPTTTSDAPTTTMKTAPATTAPATTAPATTAPPTTTGADAATSSQYAVTAEATSAYGDTSWSASQATGAPNTAECADDGNAWASLSPDGKDSLTLTYAEPVIPSAVRISINYNPNQIVLVEVVDVFDTATSIYTSVPVMDDCPALFEIPVTGVRDAVQTVRVTVDQSILGLGWTEIDAVELVGVTP